MINETQKDNPDANIGDYAPLGCLVLILIFVVVSALLPYPEGGKPVRPNPFNSYAVP